VLRILFFGFRRVPCVVRAVYLGKTSISREFVLFT
jgi:hypothetical protein